MGNSIRFINSIADAVSRLFLSKRKPLESAEIISGMPPTELQIHGVPNEILSISDRGYDSILLKERR